MHAVLRTVCTTDNLAGGIATLHSIQFSGRRPRPGLFTPTTQDAMVVPSIEAELGGRVCRHAQGFGSQWRRALRTAVNAYQRGKWATLPIHPSLYGGRACCVDLHATTGRSLITPNLSTMVRISVLPLRNQDRNRNGAMDFGASSYLMLQSAQGSWLATSKDSVSPLKAGFLRRNLRVGQQRKVEGK